VLRRPEPAAAIRLPHVVLSGFDQMALDESLLHWAAASDGRFAARTYGWARPTLSLGRAEPFPGRYDAAALREAGIDVVRRPTGGDAVLHDEEVTFAVAASVPGPWAARPRRFALLVAEALAAALECVGLPASVVGASGLAAAGRAAPGDRPCFARAAAGEVQIAGLKAAGIAARFTRGAALCHASVPLTARHRDVAAFRQDADAARAELRAHARSLGEAMGRPVDAGEVAAELFRALEERFGVRLAEGDLEEIANLEDLEVVEGAREP
jgi:lipoate-protein ligase A